MRIFQIPFSKVNTSEDVLNWMTSEETKGGKNCERYWIVRTNITIGNPESNPALYTLSVFLDMAHKNNYESVLITKEKQ